MTLARRWNYYGRIFRAYLGSGSSQLTFWHETPEANSQASYDRLGQYYMTFREKADYAGPHDSAGIPMLDYRGALGRQYNPIAIAQWGLANYNRSHSEDASRWQRCQLAADWLCANLEQNPRGLWVWNHHFDWEYRDLLKAPWYSGLAQGQGISLLLRVHERTLEEKYLHAAEQAFASLTRPVAGGGVLFEDRVKDLWIEEYIVDPPTHILNGFMWALWGVFDFWSSRKDESARQIFDRGVATLLHNLSRYDTGYWSLYEQSGTRLAMLASPFYHRLHIVQLRVMARLTGKPVFTDFADRWEVYERSTRNRVRALAKKSLFKLFYY